MASAKKKVLITEDDEAMQDALRLILERAGYEVTALDSAKPLLDGTAPIPHIYILDKQLSGVDGLDVGRFLKAQPQTAQVPVIMISASPQLARQVQAVCADGFLEKPFPQRELLAMVAEQLEKRV